MKKILRALLLLVAAFVGLLLVRTCTFSSRQPEATAVEPVTFDEPAALERFARSLTFRTVTAQDGTVDPRAFLDLHQYLRQSFPLVHQTLTVETVNELSLLYTWEGTEPELEPIVLMAHLDVVPVSPGTEEDWEQPPFGGVIADGYVWGRGSMDDKVGVTACLEGIELLLRDGFRPRRTFYLAFGHDEEQGGGEGGQVIAERLISQVESFALVMDEGGLIIEGMVPGISAPVALIATAEKGSVSVRLRVEGPGGHSSAPPERTNIGILARAITRLEDDPFPTRLAGPARSLFEFLAPEMPFLQRLAFANLWLFEGAIMGIITESPEGMAMLRTTTATTRIQGGIKNNVLPTEASAVVNLRILPGETPQTVAERLRRIIDDERVQVIGADGGRLPSPVSDPYSPAFALIGRTIREVAGTEVLVAPFLLQAGTDSRYYAQHSSNVLRFSPAYFEEGGLSRVHGTNERLAVESYPIAVRFFYQLIRGSDELR